MDRATPQVPATNPDGTPTTQVNTANFSPADGVLPFPTNLLLSGSADLTLNVPVDDPTDFSDPAVALSNLDGFSTISPWTFTFSQQIDPDSVIPGSSVRFFEVEFVFGTIAVAGINRELVPGEDYVATVAPTDPTGKTVAIVPLRPLQESTGYMAVVTDGILDTEGTPATPSQTYFLSKRTSPLVTEGGASTDPLLDDATAGALEPLRQLTNAQETAASSVGISRDDIVLSFTATTQSITTGPERDPLPGRTDLQPGCPGLPGSGRLPDHGRRVAARCLARHCGFVHRRDRVAVLPGCAQCRKPDCPA